MAIKYRIYLEDLSCNCPASRHNHKTSCKHVKVLLTNGMQHRTKFGVFRQDNRWYGGNCDLGFVGESVADVMNAIGEVKQNA